jgi:hypothetical protein
MKKILWVILVTGCFAACKKNHTILNGTLFGRWELHRRYGGNIIPPDTVYKPGNGNILQFNPDSTYKSYTNGTLTRSGAFHILKSSGERATPEPNDEIYFDNDTASKSYITISGTVLALMPLMPDIGNTQYDKISN